MNERPDWLKVNLAWARVFAVLEFAIFGLLMWFAGAYVERGKVVRIHATELNRASREFVDSTMTELRTLIPLNCDTDRPLRGCANRADSVVRKTDP